MNVIDLCEECGKAYTITRECHQNTKRFCSRKCKNKNYKRRTRLPKAPQVPQLYNAKETGMLIFEKEPIIIDVAEGEFR